MPLLSYADAEAFLNGFVNYEKLLGREPVRYDTSAFDVQRFRDLLRALGDPHLRYAVIHVAGTKGKGSTCAYIESILRHAGYRTGLYTSPHLERYTERIRTGGEPISETEFCDLLNRVSTLQIPHDPSGQAYGAARTVFEILTAAAFLHFARSGVEIAIVETGLGGRLDSTNVFDTPGAGPLVTVLTPIAYDHVSVLGHTIPEIAGEKAGILRPHGYTILASQPPDWADQVKAVVAERLQTIGAPPYVDAEHLIRVERVQGGSCPEYQVSADRHYPWPWSTLPAHSGEKIHDLESLAPARVAPSLPGFHQVDNLKTALATLLVLERVGEPARRFVTTIPAIVEGVAATQWPGRFEIVHSAPLTILDGAHCPLSARAMAETFVNLYGTDREVILVAGFLRDKPAQEILSALKGRLRVRAAVACTPPTPRARPATETAEAIGEVLGVTATVTDSPAQAVTDAQALAQGDEAILIFGSLYLIAPARAAA